MKFVQSPRDSYRLSQGFLYNYGGALLTQDFQKVAYRNIFNAWKSFKPTKKSNKYL
jgi:hypothetical protein